MGKVVGIDLGTTNSVVSVLEGSRPEVIPNSEGGKTTPSVIFFDPSGEVIVGELAKRQRVTAPDRTIYSVKRFMGCRWDEVGPRSEGIAYKIAPDEEGMVRVKIGNKKLRPEDISAHVLQKMKESAEAFLGQEIESAVVTVPAYFNDSQRTATKEAGEKAGLNIQRIINEPTAAALAYGLSKSGKREKVAVFDFGGGTFDISILDIESDIIEVKSTCGDTFLGGDNINQIIVNWVVESIMHETGIDPSADLQAMQRIVEVAEKVKCELSSLPSTVVTLPFIVADASGPKHFTAELTRSVFNEMIQPILKALRVPCEQALADAKIRPDQLTNILLVGGSTRIPAVRKLVAEIFGREPDCSMNPDEVVAQGAAIQAGVMTGEIEEVLLLDVTPLSMGIELAGNVFSPLIPRNSNIPTTVAKRFTTVVDNQSTVKVHVLQGERRVASENRSLAHFKLTGIPPAPREIPEIQVMFHMDANGILTVSATDMSTGAMQRIEIQSYVTAGVDVEKMVEEAEASVESDKLFVQKSEVRRRLQLMEMEFKSMHDRRDAEDTLTPELEHRMREAIFKWDIALAQNDWEVIEQAERNAKSVLTEVNSMFMLRGSAPPDPKKAKSSEMMAE